MRTHETPVPQIMQLKLFMGRVFLSEDEQKRINLYIESEVVNLRYRPHGAAHVRRHLPSVVFESYRNP